MEIAILTTGYPHRNDPVAGAFVRSMARALAARGHTLQVLCAALADDVPVADPGITVTPVAYGPWATFYGAGAPHTMSTSPRAVVGGGVFTLTLAAHAHRRLRACDALVSHFVLPCGMVAGWNRRGRPHLAVVHGTDGRWLARCPPWMQRTVLEGATAVQCTHEALRRSLVDASVPTMVRPMGFDPLTLPRVGAQTGELLAVAVGRLVRVKSMDRVIEAVALAQCRGACVRLVVVGDGPERNTLERLPAAQGVTFVGALDAAARDAWLAQADVFVHGAGEGEGAPVAVLEAMGAGIPVVAMDGGGVREMVGDGGAVVETMDAMAAALVRLATDTTERQAMGERGRARAWPLRWEAEAERIERVLTRDAVGAAKTVHAR